MLGSNCLPLAGAEAKFLRRASFLKHNLWVTPYARDEMFPGGEFPNQNPRVDEGLATWVKQNRSLEETDIVLWFVFSLFVLPLPLIRSSSCCVNKLELPYYILSFFGEDLYYIPYTYFFHLI